MANLSGDDLPLLQQFHPRKRGALEAGFTTEQDNEPAELQALRTEYRSLRMENESLRSRNTEMKAQLTEEQEARRIERAENASRQDRLINRIVELDTKLKKPILEQDALQKLVREDDELKFERGEALRELLRLQTQAARSCEEARAAREEWGRSVSQWQERRDEHRNKENMPVWTTKELFDNREEEIAGFKEAQDRIERSMDVCQRRLERIEEKNIKAWRDIVLENHEERDHESSTDELEESDEESVAIEVLEDPTREI